MSYIVPGRKPRKPHPADVYHAQQVARAVSFMAYFRKGPDQTFRVPATTLEEARRLAGVLTKEHGQWGRRAVIYAITPEGNSFPVGLND
jgi:hypothetical protein